jgi:conjugal transfer pilus assembly protein TraK
MKPADIPAESFVLRDESVLRKPKLPDAGKKDNLEKSVRDLMLYMAGSNSKAVSNHVYKDDKKGLEELGLWKDTKFFFVSSFVNGNLVGDKYRLYNVSDKPIAVAEQEFYQKGVVAVSVQTHVLDAGRDTFVYVVKLGEAE